MNHKTHLSSKRKIIEILSVLFGSDGKELILLHPDPDMVLQLNWQMFMKASLIDWKLDLAEIFALHLCPQVELERADGRTQPSSGILQSIFWGKNNWQKTLNNAYKALKGCPALLLILTSRCLWRLRPPGPACRKVSVNGKSLYSCTGCPRKRLSNQTLENFWENAILIFSM